jgi:hypothetical protein
MSNGVEPKYEYCDRETDVKKKSGKDGKGEDARS